MLIKFHRRGNGKRRGGILPARLRFAARRGVTLVELMIAMLILTLVCIAWLEIIGIQSARKEARRREAVERLAGMMDAFMECYKKDSAIVTLRAKGDRCYFSVNLEKSKLDFPPDQPDTRVFQVFEDDNSIGYRLFVCRSLSDASLFGDNWAKGSGSKAKKWLVGELYNFAGTLDPNRDKPFFSLPVCLWAKYNSTKK